jgi:hypothetical protein
MKPTKTQAEISKLEKQIAKLTGALAAKRRLEALRAEADALQKAIKAEPCDKPHYPPPCPLPHSPWGFTPWFGNHPWNCRCSACMPVNPWHPWVSSPQYGSGYTATNPIMTTTPNGNIITVSGSSFGSSDGTTGGLLNTGTQMGADGVPFTYTGVISESENPS